MIQFRPHLPWKMVSPDHRIILCPGTREERQYVDLFCNQTTRALSGFFSPQLWNYQLPQLSHSEPTVRHAIAAISAAHERNFLRPSAENSRSIEQFMLQQYNKSIRHLMGHLSDPKPQSADLMLITCCLFVCLEVVRGNNKQALDHLTAGATFLNRREYVAKKTAQYTDIQKELSHLFFRLNLQLSLFGRPLVPVGNGLRALSSFLREGSISFVDLEDARHCLDALMNQTLSFVLSVHTGGLPASDAVLKQQKQSQLDLLQEFHCWSTAFDQLIARRGTSKTLDKRGPLTLRAHHRVSQIWMQSCMSKDQMVFDNFNADFEAIVNLSEEVVRLSSGLDRQCNTVGFSLESEITAALWFTGIKCREPIIRRKAVRLLSDHHRQEGMWDMGLFAKVAGLVMQLEETELSSLPIAKRVPEDHQRIYDPILPEDIVTSPCQVILLSRPYGVDGELHSEVKYVSWKS
ncbi:hypothetical protein BDV25DRAFT_163015 [Aspergillus avenaceus]|uniref:C6 zinc finger domain protein n=1 Tax=Aspergillus avenaceus TaxID=36643 RepID=A0A5N6TII6_ASPAV|nr:hypothetical protein BDV25DRAFT_163015 [Aspergillus avenaceus]